MQDDINYIVIQRTGEFQLPPRDTLRSPEFLCELLFCDDLDGLSFSTVSEFFLLLFGFVMGRGFVGTVGLDGGLG